MLPMIFRVHLLQYQWVYYGDQVGHRQNLYYTRKDLQCTGEFSTLAKVNYHQFEYYGLAK